MIKVDFLHQQRRELETQRDETLAKLNQIEGAIKMLDFLIAKDAEPPPEGDTAE